MERVLGTTDKIIIDSTGNGGVVPYLPLNELAKPQAPAPQPQQQQRQGGRQ
jgi:membrane protease subunit HflK